MVTFLIAVMEYQQHNQNNFKEEFWFMSRMVEKAQWQEFTAITEETCSTTWAVRAGKRQHYSPCGPPLDLPMYSTKTLPSKGPFQNRTTNLGSSIQTHGNSSHSIYNYIYLLFVNHL